MISKDNIVSGPLSYENSKAAIVGARLQGALEYPLFTDAHITGELRDGLGPYKLLNTIPMSWNTQVLTPTIVLRAEYYLEDTPSTTGKGKTTTERYHGGWLSDEIAALTSLCLGIRLKAGGCTREFDPDGDPHRAGRDRFIGQGCLPGNRYLRRDHAHCQA